jgi:signal peptidase I
LQQFHSDSVPEYSQADNKRPGFLRFLLDVVETLILSVILFAAINAVSARIRVDGASMEPTLKSGEFVIVNKLAYMIGKPQVGDVIVFHYPRDPSQEYIKRVIGLPGDQVSVRAGRVYLNGQPLEEDYIAANPVYEAGLTVPPGGLFVLGDNRNNSSDSHNWGTVPLNYVVGKALFVYWPPTEWGMLEQPSTASAAP